MKRLFILAMFVLSTSVYAADDAWRHITLIEWNDKDDTFARENCISKGMVTVKAHSTRIHEALAKAVIKVDGNVILVRSAVPYNTVITGRQKFAVMGNTYYCPSEEIK